MAERIARFLRLYSNANTAGVYRAGIYNYLDLVYGKQRKSRQATREEKARYEVLADRYFTEGRDYFEDILSFITAQANRPPVPAKTAISCVKEWLGYHGVEFSQRQLKQLSNRLPHGSRARTVEIDVDVPMLKKILTHLDVKGKALVLVLASSGMRIGEALSVKLYDVRLDENPVEIVVRGEISKSGDQRTVFISTEAKEAVLEWLKVREDYLKTATTRNHGLVQTGRASEKPLDDDRLFPFTGNNVREVWRNTLRRAQLLSTDTTTGFIQVRIHGLRKFFRSQLALSCPVDIVEALMGHEGYLTQAYRRYSTRQMAEYYQKAEHLVTVMGTGDVKEMQDRLQDTRAEVRGYKDIIQEQAEELADLKRRMAEMDEMVKVLTPLVDALQGKEGEEFIARQIAAKKRAT